MKSSIYEVTLRSTVCDLTLKSHHSWHDIEKYESRYGVTLKTVRFTRLQLKSTNHASVIDKYDLRRDNGTYDSWLDIGKIESWRDIGRKGRFKKVTRQYTVTHGVTRTLSESDTERTNGIFCNEVIQTCLARKSVRVQKRSLHKWNINPLLLLSKPQRPRGQSPAFRSLLPCRPGRALRFTGHGETTSTEQA